MSKFYNQIKSAVIEREVEDVYNKGISLYFTEDIKHPFACDGLVETKTDNNKILKLIIEYKLDEKMDSRFVRSKVIAQVLFYLKRFENEGMTLPNVCLIGDIDECFCFHTNDILSYLDEDVDWSLAPSSAGECTDLVMKLAEDENINPYIFVIDENFSFKEVADKIKSLADNVQRYVRVTEHNISNIFDYFCKKVVKDAKKIQANDLVAIFMGVITDGDNYFQHPTKKNVLVCKDKQIAIKGDGFQSFFSYFNRNYTPQEKNKFAEISDRLIEDTNRRNKGEFYTPTLFVDYAHKMIAEQFGEDWKEKFVVWDNCFDGETEYLSENGWKKISEYDGGKVMQYNQDGSAEFVTPLHYINQEYNGEMLHYISSQMDIVCTPDHNFVVRNDRKDRNQDLFKISASELFEKYNRVKNTHLIVPKTFNYDGGLEIDENLLRVYVAVNADGTYYKKGDWYCVRVKKERKIKRMAELLSNAEIDYKLAEYGEYIEYRFHLSINPKHFPSEWYNLSNKCKEVIMEEILLWDGSLTKTKFGIRKRYSTSKKDDADFIAFVGASCGYGVNVRKDKRSQRTNYLLSFTRIKNTKISTKSTFTKEANTNGRVYCFEVESGMLVVRRNNKIYVSSNCSGTKNLTRDYYFKELYCSTLENAELAISERYNREATSFQFDFLNDDLDKLPQGLKDALENNKPIIFFINPPYSKNTGGGKLGATSEKNCYTPIREEMNKNKIGACSANLYAQFLYRIKMIKEQYNLTDVHIALFSPTNWLCGESFKCFRTEFFKHFSFNNGVLFNAGHFADVATNWGISFSIWNSGVNADNCNFNYKLIDNVEGEIKDIIEKDVYNVDNSKTASDWVREETNGLKTIDTINLTSAISVREKDGARKGKIIDGALGYYYVAGNSCCKNAQHNALYTAASSLAIGVSIIPQNFDKCTTLFSAKKVIESNWTNAEDEYFAPNTDNEHWNEFVNDSIVYSLFSAFSQQSSLRQVEYKGKLWDIKNEFFFMSRDEIKELANENNLDFTYNDANVSSERYVYTKLQGIDLSKEAQDVLDKAIELTKKSFRYREMFNEEHQEYQILVWDASYYQLKAMWKEYMPNEYKEFTDLYKKLADKMRPMVYELGFLK